MLNSPKKEFVRPNVFVSACIEFDECRFDGTMISSEFVRRLKEVTNVTWVCPEMMIGLGSPRESLRLVEAKDEELKLVGNESKKDFTSAMEGFTEKYLTRLKDKDIDGFIMKAKSPSCGITDAKIYFGTGKSHVKSAKNPGIFGKGVLDHFPNHPVESERRISNFNIRDRFFVQLFTLANLRILKEDFKYKDLVNFHSNNKYLFMSYNQTTLKKMGNIVANRDKLDQKIALELYEVELRKLLDKEPTQKARINVLTHIYGYFKNELSSEEKEYYFDTLDDYLNNKITYISVLMILRSWTIRFKQEYLLKQTVFQPYPKELLVVVDSGKNI
jgi:uncharacterized protein YbgA (DUF1722 family)/uncharacterized protein YbbK (DUF523 family)